MGNKTGVGASPSRLTEGDVADWTKIRPGEHIQVCQRGFPVAAGAADGVTRDGTMIWIIQEYPQGRSIFHKRDGINLRRQPKTVRVQGESSPSVPA